MDKTLTDLLYEYDTKRNKSESIARANAIKMYEKYPKLKQLKDEKDDVFFSAIKKVALNPENRKVIMSQAALDAAKLEEALKRFCKENDIDLSLCEPRYECTKCADTGYITEDNAKKLCPCLLKRMRIEVYGGSDIERLEGSFEKYDLAVFKSEEQRNRARQAELFAKNYCEGSGKLFTVFEGKAGLGKSFLMHCMAKELIGKIEDVVFIKAFNMFECFKKNRLGEMNNLHPSMDAQYLFIDDLGSEPMTQNVTREYFFNLIENRIAKGLKTVISTNLTNQTLMTRYGEKVTSRLLADKTADVIMLQGEDIRLR